MALNQTPYLFTQIAQFIDRKYFEYLVKLYDGNRYVKYFSCWNQLMVLVWAQLTTRRSLRDIVGSLSIHRDKLYRLGMGRVVVRSTLSEANTNRDVSIFRELALRMMNKVSTINVIDDSLQTISQTFKLSGFFAVDSSTIQLNKTLYDWSTPKQGYGGIKIHTLFDLLRYVPALVMVTGHEEGDQIFMEDYPYTEGCFYVFDKCYVKSRSLAYINKQKAYFVVRRKSDLDIEVIKDNPVSQDGSVLADQIILFKGSKSKKGYDSPLRMITYYSKDKNETFVFLTNSTELQPYIIAYLYLRRWDIEQFFRWVKQHLYIQDFYGRSVNAVCIQIYVAVITYCIICLIADQYNVKASRYELMRCLGTALFEKRYLSDVIAQMTPGEFDSYDCMETLGMKSLFDEK